MSRYWLAAIGGGFACALIYSLTGVGSFGGVLLAYFAPLPLYLVGLSFGLTAGTVAGAVATVTMALLGGVMSAGIFLLVNALPTLVVIRQALLSRYDNNGTTFWYPAGRLIISITVMGVVLYTIAAIMLSARPEGFQGSVEAFVTQLAEQMVPLEAADKRPGIVAMVAPILPGFVVISWLVMVIVNAALAQGLLVRFNRNKRSSPDITTMTFPGWFPVVAAIVALAGLVLPGTLGYYGGNLTAILIMPFFFMGLAVVHAICRKRSTGAFLLVFFYGLLIIFGWLAVVVAMLGLVEQWAELRRRFA